MPSAGLHRLCFPSWCRVVNFKLTPLPMPCPGHFQFMACDPEVHNWCKAERCANFHIALTCFVACARCNRRKPKLTFSNASALGVLLRSFLEQSGPSVFYQALHLNGDMKQMLKNVRSIMDSDVPKKPGIVDSRSEQVARRTTSRCESIDFSFVLKMFEVEESGICCAFQSMSIHTDPPLWMFCNVCNVIIYIRIHLQIHLNIFKHTFTYT